MALTANFLLGHQFCISPSLIFKKKSKYCHYIHSKNYASGFLTAESRTGMHGGKCQTNGEGCNRRIETLKNKYKNLLILSENNIFNN